MIENHVKLFISYSWRPENHEKWVIDLATALRGDGVDVILDKWDLKEGHDAHKFMEQMVADESIRKVAIICNKTYVEKANERAGGVGTETQIITPEIYQKTDQNKFVAVIAERDDNDKPYLPIFYQSRIYIDLSNNDQYATNYEQLLRWVYDKPLNIKPDLGHKPAFLEEATGPILGTTTHYKRALDFIRFDRPNWQGALKEYTEIFVLNLENFRLQLLQKENAAELVLENIEQFLPYRNEAIEIFQNIALYKNNEESYHILHRFFEKLIPYMSDNPPGTTTHTAWDLDNYRFITHELFLYCISIFLKHECFSAVIYLINNFYYIGNNSYRNETMISFAAFRHYLQSLDNLGKRDRRLSIRADLLEQRSQSTGISIIELMQADFMLYMRSCFEALNHDNRHLLWWPETLLYLFKFRGGIFEIFARSQSKAYFEKICPILGITNKGQFEKLKLAYQTDQLKIPRWEFESFDPFALMDERKIAIRA